MSLPARFILICVLLLGLPATAWANAGTSLMWATMFHLLVGNALIACLEGALLGFLFRVPIRKAITIMLPANYLSAWLGGWLLTLVVLDRLHLNLNNAWQWFWIMTVITYVATLAMEWPFVAWSLRGSTGWLPRSVRASLVVQTVSYLVLFGWYWSASGTSLYRRAEVVAASQLPLPADIVLFFIQPDDGAAYRKDSVSVEKICDLHSTHKNDRLLVAPEEAQSATWRLSARLETGRPREPRTVVILTNLSPAAVPAWSDNRQGREGSWMNFGDAQRFAGSNLSEWQFTTGFWPVGGLNWKNTRTGERARIAYETAFGQWAARNAIHLPNDNVLFQLGDDQVCVFDPKTRRIALVCRGRGPMVLLREAQTSFPPASR